MCYTEVPENEEAPCPSVEQLKGEELCPDGQEAMLYQYNPTSVCSYYNSIFTYELVTGWGGCCSVEDENFNGEPHCVFGEPAYRSYGDPFEPGIECDHFSYWMPDACPMNTHCVKSSPGRHGLCCPDASIVQPDECPDVSCNNDCNGMAFRLDERGCKTCECMPHVCPTRNCPVCTEDKYWYSYDSNRCQTCNCIQNPPECPVLDCYCGDDEPAFVVDDNLCPMCKCRSQPVDNR